MAQQSLQSRGITQIQESFTGAKTQVSTRHTHHHRASRGGRLITAIQILSGFNQRDGSTRRDAQSMQGFRGDHLPYTSLQGESSITTPAPWRRSRALGSEVLKVAVAVSQLPIQKAPTIAELGVVVPKLEAVIAQSQEGNPAFKASEGLL